jgi:hypothetical protein
MLNRMILVYRNLSSPIYPRSFKRNKSSPEITPLVESLSGVISLDKDFDVKDAYADYLLEKYK